MEDYLLLEKIAQFNRERIPERVVHAKGAGAHGTFAVTGDIAKYTSAKLFNQAGKKTRRSRASPPWPGEKASADTARDQPARSNRDVGFLVPLARVVSA